MKASRTALVATVAATALVGSVAVAMAQSSMAQSSVVARQRVIEVPPGATVIVLPAGVSATAGDTAETGFPLADMPSPVSMIRQIDDMMAALQNSFTAPAWFGSGPLTQAGFPAPPVPQGPVSGVVVTSYSDGHGVCTQRITYAGNGSAPVVHVSDAGNACSGLDLPRPASAVPAAAPDRIAPPHGAPHLIHVRDNTRAPAPLVYAQAAG
jgi:hypothetical protein